MRRPQGYAILTDPDLPGGKQEWDTYTCAHCQRVIRVLPRQDPATMGGFCRGCMQHICAPCTEPGTCEIFERKLDQYERAHRFGVAAGLVLRLLVILSVAMALAGWAHAADLFISWVDNASDETSFELERGSDPDGTFVNIATLAANTTTYRDINVTPNTQYCYRVRACNANGCSAYTTDSGSICQRAPQLPKGRGFHISKGIRAWDVS